mmetsp:Transcript_52715/g.133859  ORF Transcript_52715/g.133859 Transcript_52715/m.133859 type:complete len:177 (-) Transcript_52715:76-606(-)
MLLGLASRTSRQLLRGCALAGAASAAGSVPRFFKELRCEDKAAKSEDSGFKMPSMASSMAMFSPADLGPLGGSLSVGSTLGFCSGYAVKKTGKAAAFFVGCIFCMQQALSYLGYVEVNWKNVERDLMSVMDVNGDGKIDAQDMNLHYVKLLKMLQHNTYSLSGGFGAGFLYGVKKG